ncbi:MAG TPA: class I SAM-dependent methyltransferase [Saprospiraceae bacterium]|nr:class I SAM-dependent methyltransferase [Saprospiraceae bacterium]
MSILRNLFYSLPTGFRFVARNIVYYPVDVIDGLRGKRDKNVPPKRMIYTGGGDFLKIGNKIVDHIKAQNIITPHSKVLDVGSGIGRIAIPLTKYLTDGIYEGFDIVKSGVKWCEQHISHNFPNFHFQWIPLSNDLYRDAGKDAGQFVFPYEDETFDLAIVISVFTHMQPAEVENYLNEIRRVLKHDGYCYATFFILNQDSEEAMQTSNEFNFKYHHGHFSLLNEKVKAANVAFREKYLDDLFVNAHFNVVGKDYGSWSGAYPESAFDFQDTVVLKRN